MIRFAFNRLDVREHTDYGIDGQHTRTEFRVIHPSNGAIIAYADTKQEAEAVVGLIAGLAALCKEGSMTPSTMQELYLGVKKC